ncbi:hypothetical protein RhiirA1_463537 [Rhizophagus irregularis]|uniref:Uncharacterized protein n=1 Tax=Rhizophagus irregularis TaxID=588596 RepID=A0A2N0RJV4_9GLOM|nr:hypothetical protein RhiirA1_463537 [Rhizophagus irregularis]
MVLNVLSVKESLFTPNYDIKAIYNIEVLQPNKLQITIYEVSLKEDDKLRIQENESYIPYPTLRNQSGTSFLIDPQKYDFKKISQFDSRKFLLVLYNKERLRIEIFFDTAQRLAHDFNSSNSRSIKTLNADENFLIAINEPKGLLAIYNTKEAKLNVFSFDDSRSRLHGRNANIQLLKWYDEKIPNIKYFLFIKDTEELCFVENSGQARIFKLVNLQFRPAVCNFPYNLDLVNVLSSPDGSCIMAFTKEKLKNKPDEDNPIIFTGNKEQHGYKNDFKEINRVYVYFFENFGDSFSKVIDLPLNFNLGISSNFLNARGKKSLTLQRTNLNDFINTYKLMFEKYPIDSCIDPKQNCPLSLKNTTRNLKNICCLIPMQIAVTRNNLFQPLKDGLSSDENYFIEDGHHVDNIAKNISFGWYEGIFKHFGYKKDNIYYKRKIYKIELI